MVANNEGHEDRYESDEEGQVDEPSSIYDSISVRQERAIICLLSEPTLAKAADAAGVGKRSLTRWMDKPAFAKAYRKARRDAFGQSIALTQHYAPLAVNTLATIMADKQAPAHARVTAAASLLKFGREGLELDDLALRVEALEEAAGASDPRVNRR